MNRLDLIKRFSAENDPDWPDCNLQNILYPDDEVGCVLSSFDFDFDAWLSSKLLVSRGSPSERIFRYPQLPTLLSFDEYSSLAQTELSQDDTHYRWYHFFSPTISPRLWCDYRSPHGKFSQRVWWLFDQWHWVHEGFPAPPDIVWHSKRHLRPILHELVYYPFITTFEVPSFDFCIKLSNTLDTHEYWRVLHAFIWAFEDLGKDFPSPCLYYYFKQQQVNKSSNFGFAFESDTMSLSQDFWLWLEQETKE